MENNVIVGNVCFIKDKETKKILFLKRKKAPMAGKYTGVGGKTDFSEDIYSSCLREVKEETGLLVQPKLKAILKTVLENRSSWILFVYVAEGYMGSLKECPEGELLWVEEDKIQKLELIGFIKKIIPCILDDKCFLEATFCHNRDGEVLEEKINYFDIKNDLADF